MAITNVARGEGFSALAAGDPVLISSPTPMGGGTAFTNFSAGTLSVGQDARGSVARLHPTNTISDTTGGAIRTDMIFHNSTREIRTGNESGGNPQLIIKIVREAAANGGGRYIRRLTPVA